MSVSQATSEFGILDLARLMVVNQDLDSLPSHAQASAVRRAQELMETVPQEEILAEFPLLQRISEERRKKRKRSHSEEQEEEPSSGTTPIESPAPNNLNQTIRWENSENSSWSLPNHQLSHTRSAVTIPLPLTDPIEQILEVVWPQNQTILSNWDALSLHLQTLEVERMHLGSWTAEEVLEQYQVMLQRREQSGQTEDELALEIEAELEAEAATEEQPQQDLDLDEIWEEADLARQREYMRPNDAIIAELSDILPETAQRIAEAIAALPRAASAA